MDDYKISLDGRTEDCCFSDYCVLLLRFTPDPALLHDPRPTFDKVFI